MPADNRKGSRRYVAHGARITWEGSADLTDCRMADVSAFGARLELKDVEAIPEQFILLLSHDGRLRRQCKVVWRSKDAIGVEFKPPFPVKVKKASAITSV